MKALEKPDGESWKTAELKKVWLTDECPTIGSGVRFVWVVEGKKFARIAGPFGSRAKLSIRDFNHVLIGG